MSDQLLRAIKEVQSEIANHPDGFHGDEENTKDYLIKPVLNALGWKGLARLKNQYKLLGRKKVDMALIRQDAPVVLVEAKALNIQLDNEPLDQIIGYCIRSEAETALLTNGAEWRVYRPWLKNLTFEQRLLFSLRLDKDDAKEVVNKLSMLGYDSIDQLEKQDLNILLEAYWAEHAKKDLLNAFSGVLRDSIVNWSGRGSGEIPAGKVKTWLRRKMFSLQNDSKSPQRLRPVPSSGQETGLTVVLEEEHFHAENYRYVLVYTAEWLVKRGRLDRPVRIGKAENDLVNHYSEHKEQRRKHLKDLSNGLSIYTNYTPKDSVKNARKLLEFFDYDPKILRIIEYNNES
ncbi:MAG: type I restriction enzyme HsdR N-terminal domain-containing protein [Anaerolineaceae bacterium]|nr:type I restriction enzyme HsdR N-terminal domain-containing protein [Anaerolineaceae bacterium]